MSNRAIVGYIDESGEWRGTYVHQQGDSAPYFIYEAFGRDYSKIVEWIEGGIAKAGYMTAKTIVPCNDDQDSLVTWDMALEMPNCDYIWTFGNDGRIDHKRTVR